MNGAQQRLAALAGGGFAVVAALITFANAESTISDLAAAGVVETAAHVWIWEITSLTAWVSAMPAIWWLVRTLRPPKFAWPLALALLLVLSVPASFWHVGVMVTLRKLAYLANGEHYRFFDVVGDKLIYEYRKDVASYLQFAAIAAAVQWLLARAASVPPPQPLTLLVGDGAVTHHVPLDEIDYVRAAGNYVELVMGSRTLLHRATLAAVEVALGPDFVRIHRSRLVRRAAIRTVETNTSGDFDVTLTSGAVLRGSRRFREGVEDKSAP